MSSESVPTAARYGACRICGCSIVNRGKGWYHTESPTSAVSGHFAAPRLVTA